MFDAYGFQLTDIPAGVRPYVYTAARLIGRALGFVWDYEVYRSAGGMRAQDGNEHVRTIKTQDSAPVDDASSAAVQQEL
jgi:hypothetical protein